MSDTDQLVAEHASTALLEQGNEIIPELERLADSSFTDAVKLESIERILAHLRFQSVKSSLSNWLQSEEKDLMEAAYAICSYQFPELSIEEFTNKFQTLRHECWMKINPRQTSFESVRAFNRVFFDEFDFKRVDQSPHLPFDLFLNSVLESREGTDVALGLIYCIVAQSLDLPVFGVASLNNRAPFMLGYLDQKRLLPLLDWGIDNNGVLFYISVGTKGVIVDPQNLKEIFESKGLPQHRAQFEPSANSLIIKKYISDIRRSYSNQPHFRYKLSDLDELLDLF